MSPGPSWSRLTRLYCIFKVIKQEAHNCHWSRRCDHSIFLISNTNHFYHINAPSFLIFKRCFTSQVCGRGLCRLLFFSVIPLALPADRRVEPAGLVTGPGAQATAVHRAVEREEHVVLIFTQLAAIPLTATNLQQAVTIQVNINIKVNSHTLCFT